MPAKRQPRVEKDMRVKMGYLGWMLHYRLRGYRHFFPWRKSNVTIRLLLL
jgi:hypothetical protein